MNYATKNVTTIHHLQHNTNASAIINSVKDIHKPRPYWHVDMKWAFGILLFCALLVSTVLLVASTLLSPKIALPSATYVVASQFSRDGLDDASDIKKIESELKKSGKNEFQPIEGSDAVITKGDIASLSPREIRLKLFGQIVEPIYYGTEELDKNTAQQYGALAILNEKTHDSLVTFFWISLIPVTLFMAGLVFFSHRYGRLVSPAIMLLLFSLLPSLFLFLIQNAATSIKDNEPFGLLPREQVLDIASVLSPYFYGALATGTSLLLAIPAIKLARKIIKPKDSKK